VTDVRTVAVLGTGIMGGAMARNLAKAGLRTRAWNRTREKAEPLGEDGIEVADSAAAAVEGADAAITMLANADAVRDVAIGEGGAISALGPEAIWLQMSTIGLAGTEELAAPAAEREVTFVDAPVLGTKQPAEAGELIVLASGPDAALEACEPIFDAVGARTVRLGAAGNGTRMKLVLNSWLLTLTAGLAEAFALAERLNIDPARFLEVIKDGPIGVPYAELKGRMMIEGEFPAAFPLYLARKDADIVLEAGERDGAQMPLARAIAGRFSEAEEAGHGEEDMAAVYEAALREGGRSLGDG
jgi:3-hydroxyisobutyrate dehydrogenase